MGKVSLSEIVSLPVFDEVAETFYKTTNLIISFYDDSGEIVFRPAGERCAFCQLVQSTAIGRERCIKSDMIATEQAMNSGSPMFHKCHAGLTDIVIPVMTGEKRIGCFYSGQLLLEPLSAEKLREIEKNIADLNLDPLKVRKALDHVLVMDKEKLELQMRLLSIVCNHLAESEITLRKEKELTQEQRKLRKSEKEKARLEQDLREMELRLIQAQLNPHFLFNALNLIVSRAMLENAPETCQLVRSLALLLRGALTNISSMISFAEELSTVQAYLEVFIARFDKKIDLTIDVPQEINTLKVPTLILQPLIENALIHGLPRSKGPFSLKITAVKKNGHAEIHVTDNGGGIQENQMLTLIESFRTRNFENKLTGLLGLDRRLQYYYPGIPHIQLSQSDDCFTVTLNIPSDSPRKTKKH